MRTKWPKLRPENHAVTSLATARYNCMAFANGDEKHWWQANENGQRYSWPAKIPDTLDGWVQVFTQQGYEHTDERGVEPGYEKVAIFVDLTDMLPGHVSISDGKTWKSKLGRFQDIRHDSLDLLEGDTSCEYGIVERILRRPITGKRKS